MDTQNVTKQDSERRAFSVGEVAEQYGISKGLVRLEIDRGKLAAVRIGHRLVIPVESLENWLSNGAR